jgi:hypothetical protein
MGDKEPLEEETNRIISRFKSNVSIKRDPLVWGQMTLIRAEFNQAPPLQLY